MDNRLPLREQLRRAWARLRGGELTPRRAFWSVAVGIFIGILPTPGLHIFMVLGVCLPLRLDAAVSYLAANISIPPVAPFLWFASIQLGARILSGSFVPLTVEGAAALVRSPGPLLASLAVGSIALGAGAGTLFGAFAYAIARLRHVPSDFEKAVQRTASRYAARGVRHYVAAKLTGDPATEAVAARAPLGEVLDLGCGRGQLGLFLLELGAAGEVHGFDWDEKKIAVARAAAKDSRARFEEADVRAAPGEAADTVLLVDVLHYLSADEQDALLARAAEKVRAGGRLLVREVTRGRGLRSSFTVMFERVSTAVRFNRGERVLVRDVEGELVPVLERHGLTCTVVPCWRGTPFANVLLVAERPR